MGKNAEATGFRIQWDLRELGPRPDLAIEPVRTPRPADRGVRRAPARPTVPTGRRAGAGS